MEPSAQQFSLRWNNYSNHISTAFERLRSQEELVDVTLCCEGRKIRAHKILLSSCSTYFRDIFKENPCQHPVIIFKNVKYEDLHALIEFMYQGEVNVQQESLSSFLNTAEVLSVQGLTICNEGNEASPMTTESFTSLANTLPIVRTDNHQQHHHQNVSQISQIRINENSQILSNKKNDLSDEKTNSYVVPSSAIVSATSTTTLSSPPMIGVIPSGASIVEIPSTTSTPLSNRNITTSAAKIRILEPQDFQSIKKRRASELDEIVSLRGYVSSGSLNVVNNISGVTQTNNLLQQKTDDGPKYFKMEIPEEYIEDHCRVAAQRQQHQQQQQHHQPHHHHQQQQQQQSENLTQQQHQQEIQQTIIAELNKNDEQTEEELEDDDEDEEHNRGVEDLEDEMEEEDDENHDNNQQIIDDCDVVEQIGIVNQKQQSEYKIIEENDSEPELLYQSHENEVQNDESFTLQQNKDESLMITVDQGQQQQTQDIPSKWSQCQFCKLVITTANLWRHIRTQHTAQPQRQCEHCQKKFKNKYSLREHVRIAHELKALLTTNTTNVSGSGTTLISSSSSSTPPPPQPQPPPSLPSSSKTPSQPPLPTSFSFSQRSTVS